MQTTYGTAVLKAVQILGFLSTVRTPQSLKEICEGTCLNKATVFKLLETLQLVGYVEKTNNSSYQLGLELIKLGQAALQRFGTLEVVSPYLEKLNKETEETVHFGVENNNEVVYLSKLESNQTVRMYSKVGNASPLYCTGIGKAILSTYSKEKLLDYLEKTSFYRFTENTLINPEVLQYDLEKIRERGYSIDDCEHEQDVRCIAVPLISNGILFGAISITAPSYRMSDEIMQKYLPYLKECQEGILSKLQFIT